MIDIRNIHKAFGDNPVFKGLSLEIFQGETITIIGGSGSGKSVLFKHIIGLMKPDSGAILFNGVDITRMSEKELYVWVQKFGMVFQGGALFDSLTVGENVAFGLKEKHSPEQLERIINESLSQVGLPDIQHMLPAELSGGMKKRVSIARIIARNPEIIMYDEPTTGLDPIMADVINNLIIKVARRQPASITTIVITHDMVSAYKISDRIAVLFDGRIIETGGPDEIRASANPVVRQFIEGHADGPIHIR